MEIIPSILLFVGVLGFSVGIVTIPEVGYSRLLTLGSATCAFFIGVCCANNIKHVDRFANVCIFIGIVYCFVCMAALLKLYPPLFPLKLSLGFRDGVQVIRPEITTDQNFQIFYLLPSVLVLALPFRIKRFLLSFTCFSLSFYILTQLKTRSGILVLLGTLLLCIVAPLGSRQLGKTKILSLPLFMGLIAILFLPLIIGFSTGLIERFTGSYHTFYGRIISIVYLAKHVLLPEWWIPQGNAAFIKATGNLPHSNITAFFLEGGLPGLVAWIGLFLIPLIRLFVKFAAKRFSVLETVLFIGCISTMVAQLSLNAPLHEHVWLWGGIGVGLCRRPSFSNK